MVARHVVPAANHPVWTVYDRLRTARLNVKYYSERLSELEALNFWLELLLLVSAPTSAIAGLWFWDTEWGRITWQGLGVVAALAATAKPLLGLTKKIKDFESSVSGYRALEYDLMQIKALIEQKQAYDQNLQSEFRKALEREKVLVVRSPETRERLSLKKRCQDQVLQELPVESFFVPES